MRTDRENLLYLAERHQQMMTCALLLLPIAVLFGLVAREAQSIGSGIVGMILCVIVASQVYRTAKALGEAHVWLVMILMVLCGCAALIMPFYYDQLVRKRFASAGLPMKLLGLSWKDRNELREQWRKGFE